MMFKPRIPMPNTVPVGRAPPQVGIPTPITPAPQPMGMNPFRQPQPRQQLQPDVLNRRRAIAGAMTRAY